MSAIKNRSYPIINVEVRVKHHLILTIDYELFGNGTGCLDHCVIHPTRQCLDTLDEFSAPMSFFVDASEFLAIKQVAQKQLAYSQFDALEQQLRDAFVKQHNLQLHLHPQWLAARFDKNNTQQNSHWQLDFTKWRIGDLNATDLEQCITEGMAYLKQLLDDPSDSRHLSVFRAGGWAIQPCEQVLQALTRHGIKMDTTVAPGAYNSAKGDWYDFRQAPNAPFWSIDSDVCQAAANSLTAAMTEIPIATASIGRVKHVRALLENRKRPSLPEGCNGTYHGPNDRWQSMAGKASKLANLGRVMLDYSTLPADLLIETTQQTMERFSETDAPIPIVAIGHNKNFTRYSNRHLHDWLKWANAHPDIQLSDYQQWAKAANLDVTG